MYEQLKIVIIGGGCIGSAEMQRLKVLGHSIDHVDILTIEDAKNYDVVISEKQLLPTYKIEVPKRVEFIDPIIYRENSIPHKHRKKRKFHN